MSYTKGAIVPSSQGAPEESLARPIAAVVAAEFVKRGCAMLVTRPYGNYSDHSQQLADEMAHVFDFGPQFVVHIHSDSAGARETAFQLIYDDADDKALAGRVLAVMKKRFPQNAETRAYMSTDEEASGHSLFVLTHDRNLPSVLIECGNYDQADDVARLKDPKFRLKFAGALADALLGDERHAVRIAGFKHRRLQEILWVIDRSPRLRRIMADLYETNPANRRQLRVKRDRIDFQPISRNTEAMLILDLPIGWARTLRRFVIFRCGLLLVPGKVRIL